MSDTPKGPPAPPPDPPRPGPTAPGGASALQVTLRVGDRAIDDRVAAGGDLLPDAPIPLTARRVPGGWIVEGPDGTHRLDGGGTFAARHGELEVRVAPVAQARFARFRLEQGDAVLPVIMMATSVLVLQIGLLFSLFTAPGGGEQGWEPSPEYIARLLRGEYDGKEQGVVAHSTPRPKTGDAIESYYLQPGHDGPRDKIGGGANVGDEIRQGDKEEQARREKTAAGKEAGSQEAPVETPPVVADVQEEDQEAADGEDEEAEEDRPIAVHVDEGWGLTDWYDTQDARKDAEEITRELERARDVLKLDPDDPQGLVTRAYYEYMAFDFDAAARTYEHFTRLYPEDPAGWNNYALVYKRKAEYQKEEELYRVALGLSPEDDHALMNLALCVAHQGRFDEAIQLMEKTEMIRGPDDPYVELHYAKIYAAMGKEDRAYRMLQKSLAGMRKLDTLHNIEFRQDIRVDPAFDTMREQDRFRNLLNRYYGDRAEGWWNKKKGSR